MHFQKVKHFFLLTAAGLLMLTRSLILTWSTVSSRCQGVSLRHPVKVWGGAGSSFMVNANSPKKEEAVKFLQWLTAQEQQQFLAAQTNNLPSIKGCEKELSEPLKGMLHALDNLTHPDTWPINEDSRVLEVFNLSLQQIVSDIKSPQEAAKNIQDKKEKVLK